MHPLSLWTGLVQVLCMARDNRAPANFSGFIIAIFLFLSLLSHRSSSSLPDKAWIPTSSVGLTCVLVRNEGSLFLCQAMEGKSAILQDPQGIPLRSRALVSPDLYHACFFSFFFFLLLHMAPSLGAGGLLTLHLEVWTILRDTHDDSRDLLVNLPIATSGPCPEH